MKVSSLALPQEKENFGARPSAANHTPSVGNYYILVPHQDEWFINQHLTVHRNGQIGHLGTMYIMTGEVCITGVVDSDYVYNSPK